MMKPNFLAGFNIALVATQVRASRRLGDYAEAPFHVHISSLSSGEEPKDWILLMGQASCRQGRAVSVEAPKCFNPSEKDLVGRHGRLTSPTLLGLGGTRQ